MMVSGSVARWLKHPLAHICPVLHTEGGVFNTICHDLFSDLDLQQPEGLSVIIYRNVEAQILRPLMVFR